MYPDDKCLPYLGHEVTLIGAWAWDTFTLSAVLYVDDSDPFHMALGTPLDEDLLQIVQSATMTGRV